MITFKAANFIEAIQAHAARNPPRVPRVAGRSLDEFAQNIGKFRKKAPNFAAQADKTVESMRAVAAQSPKPVSIGGIPGSAPHSKGELFPLLMRHDRGNAFVPGHGIRLDAPHPPTAGHEMGHAVDGGLGMDFGSRGFFGDPKSAVPSEVSATRRSFSANGTDPRLAAATGTYIQAAGPREHGHAYHRIGAENARARYGLDVSSTIPSFDSSSAVTRYLDTGDRLYPHFKHLDSLITSRHNELTRATSKHPLSTPEGLRLRAEKLTLPHSVDADNLPLVAQLFPGQVPAEALRDAGHYNLLAKIIKRRETDAYAFDNIRETLANPILNPKVAPRGAQLETADSARAALHQSLSSHLSPEAGHAADAFVRQQQAISAQDPDFAENLARTQLRRLGLADEPSLRKVMAPDAP